MAPPEILGPMGVDAVYKASYDWCCCKGRLPIRRLARQDLERSASRIIRQILDSNVQKRYPPEMFL